MNIKLTDLEHRKGEPLPFQTTLEADELKSRHQEVRGMSDVNAQGEAMLLGGLYYVNGKMDADVNFVCARCLKPFQEHMTVPFSETFASPDSDVEYDEESDIHPVEGDEIELDPILQEDFLLALPIIPFCEEDCKGLCPTCGVNWNEQQCSCNNQRIDPRLAGLADFFKNEK
ncbi:YceD family protein [Brevibacillus ginsengisoli]|uniref:YceD family protein n=1 Tax=Brevibacillus ginsengisoli TaxID=363854 RepID=UPI003CE8D147